MPLRPAVSDEDWAVVSWLWQLFRYDMSRITGGGGLPRANGRYSTRDFDPAPHSANHAGYIWWEQNENGPAPGGFSVVGGLLEQRNTINGFWVAPPLRRAGVGRSLARESIDRHDGAWMIGFQHTNTGGGAFWRRVMAEAFGSIGHTWTETRRPVPGHPDVPADHWLETT